MTKKRTLLLIAHMFWLQGHTHVPPPIVGKSPYLLV